MITEDTNAPVGYSSEKVGGLSIDMTLMDQDSLDIINSYSSANDLVAGFVNLKKENERLAMEAETANTRYDGATPLIGRKVEEYSRENWDTVNQMLGGSLAPSSPEVYHDDRIVFDTEEAKDNFYKSCHKYGVRKDAAFELYQDNIATVRGLHEQAQHMEQVRRDESINHLREFWGNAYESKVRSVGYAIENVLPKFTGLSSEEIVDSIDADGLRYNTVFLKLAAQLGEANMPRGHFGGASVISSPHDASIELDHMKKDPLFTEVMGAGMSHPRYAEVKGRYDAVLKRMYNL